MIDEKKLIEDICHYLFERLANTSIFKLSGKRIEQVTKMRNDIIDIINKQPKTDWIPCEVEMPKENGYYEVTVFRYEGDENNVFDLWYEDGEWYVDEVGEETKDEFLFVHEVIAWQPLPQPYKKEGNSDAC